MGFAKTPRSRGRKSCHEYLGIGHAGSLAIAIRQKIQGISREAWSGTGPVCDTRRVVFSDGPSTLTVALCIADPMAEKKLRNVVPFPGVSTEALLRPGPA